MTQNFLKEQEIHNKGLHTKIQDMQGIKGVIPQVVP